MFNSLLKYKFLLAVLVSALGVGRGQAQTDVNQPEHTYSLEDCIRIALETNPQVRISQLQVRNNDNILQQSKWQRWPSLGFSAGQGFSAGRNIDPYTNVYVQRNVNSSNFNLNSTVTLFNGFQLQNTVRRNSTNLQASEADLEVTRNDIMLNVALVYLQVITNEELIAVAQSQVEASRLQMDRTSRLVDAGTLAESNLLDLKAQVANDELSLVNAENNLETAKLNLKQLMNMPGSEPIEVVKIDVADPTLAAYDASIQEIFEVALSGLPQMKAAQLRIEAADRSIEIAKGAGMPSLSLSGGIGSAYSSAAPKERFVADGTGSTIQDIPSTTSYVSYAGVSVPVINKVTVPNGRYENFGYFNQLDGNRNTGLNLSLRIPIFSNFQVKYNVANAKLQKQNLVAQSEQAMLTIRKNVEQAYIDMTNAAKRYSATANQVQALEEAFRVSQVRFDVGAINSLDYNIAKANLDRAKSNLVQTKYDYVFRTKILDFYMNRPLSDF
ncbi:TolC family protein [Dyadobacter tibetensis]|uniref:TolC family protein n=1 Tax=Dyadobacter tibetensis TaxID=1211851 RepID=UPI0004725AB7|nr:TolC family protein [Dyadobacter tibetensis]